jgi:hypothetical protein
MKNRFACSLLLILEMIVLAATSALAQNVKPYRVLLIISNQWKDPGSFLVAGGGEFQTIVILFKSWGIPFDVLRLDQQAMDPNHFTDMRGRPRFGAILWDADTAGRILPQDFGPLADAVEKKGISFIAIGNRIKEKPVQDILGIRYQGELPNASHVSASAENSFLLRGLDPDLEMGGPNLPSLECVQVVPERARVLARQGDMAAITERELGQETRAIWIGGDVEKMFLLPAIRTVLRRAVTEAIGYALVKTWADHVILTMDDMGNAQNSWLASWHYPELTQEQIRKNLIEPLRLHHAILSLNLLPGFVDDTRRRIVPSWQQRFVDAFGTMQDYISTKRGVDEGVAAGVFEIESHGWTHMQPDLDSAPGPWWGAQLDGERAQVGWYREFYDTRRNHEIPAATQKFHMLQSKDWITKQFGLEPLAFATGGNAVSRSRANNTWRLAAEAGFGYYGGYLGADLAIEGLANDQAEFGGSEDVPLVLPAPPDGHDRGITRDPGAFVKVFDLYPGHVFTGLDEYVGYMHADTRMETGPRAETGKAESPEVRLSVTYDPHYCRALIAKGSSWSLHLSDWLRAQLRPGKLSVNGTKTARGVGEWTNVRFEPGRTRNSVEIH